jgi:hypothetical protein
MTQYKQPPSDGYKLSDPNLSSNPFQRASSFHQEFPRSGNFLVRSIWFMFDVTLSLMMAASTSMVYSDTNTIRQQIVDMPLVEGTSLTSDALCRPIVQELAKIKEEKDPAYERLDELNEAGTPTPASSYLHNITSFAKNCERRWYVEQRIRQERGIQNTDPVEIPPPGVSKTGPRLVVENGQQKVLHEDGTEESFTVQVPYVNDESGDSSDFS